MPPAACLRVHLDVHARPCRIYIMQQKLTGGRGARRGDLCVLKRHSRQMKPPMDAVTGLCHSSSAPVTNANAWDECECLKCSNWQQVAFDTDHVGCCCLPLLLNKISNHCFVPLGRHPILDTKPVSLRCLRNTNSLHSRHEAHRSGRAPPMHMHGGLPAGLDDLLQRLAGPESAPSAACLSLTSLCA